MNGTQTVRLLNLGRTEYADAHGLQLRLHDRRRLDAIPDTLMLTEHEPVITTGRGADFRHLLVDRDRLRQLGVRTVFTERGGDITYHGPGQLVAYPILDLRGFGRDVRAYVRSLEESGLLLLRNYGVEAIRRAGQPGLYVGSDKIASIGVFIRGWVSMHGVAINLSLAADHAALLDPCGLAGTCFTSVELITGHKPGIDDAFRRYAAAFADAFDCSTEPVSRSRCLSG